MMHRVTGAGSLIGNEKLIARTLNTQDSTGRTVRSNYLKINNRLWTASTETDEYQGW